MKNIRRGSVLYLTSNLSRISYITEMRPWILELLFKTKQKPNVFMLQGETQDCEVSLLLPCPKTCKNLWRSCVDHHSFFSSNRTARSPKYNNSTVQSYKKLITQHLGLGNSKTERWACACIFMCSLSNCYLTKVSFLSFLMFSGPVCQRVVGGMVWNPVLQRSISSEHLETKSLPSRSPPTTPNWYDLQGLSNVSASSFCPVFWWILVSLAGEVLEFAMASVNLARPQLNWPMNWKTCQREKMSSTHTGHLWAVAGWTVKGIHRIS